MGTFDGVHVGHREVIAGAEQVVTFSPHPRAVLGSTPLLLQDLETKIGVFAELGVAEVVLVPFDRQMASKSPSEFIDGVLVGALNVSRVSVGENFRFGRGGSGSPADLKADARFETVVHGLVVRQGAVVSSTRIRELIQAGRLEAAAALLGAPFTATCVVERRSRRGGLRLAWPAGVVRPRCGTYAATLHLAGAASPIDAVVSVEPDSVHWPSAPRLELGVGVSLRLRRAEAPDDV